MHPGGLNPARPRESTGRLCGRWFPLRRQEKSGKKSFVVFYSALWEIRECRDDLSAGGKRSCGRRGEIKRRGRRGRSKRSVRRARAAKRGVQEAPGQSGADESEAGSGGAGEAKEACGGRERQNVARRFRGKDGRTQRRQNAKRRRPTVGPGEKTPGIEKESREKKRTV